MTKTQQQEEGHSMVVVTRAEGSTHQSNDRSQQTINANSQVSTSSYGQDQKMDFAIEFLKKSYLPSLSKNLVLPLTDKIDVAGDVRLFLLDRLVSENRELILENAMATYMTLGARGHSVFFLIDSDAQDTHLYIGVRGAKDAWAGNDAGNLLEQAFQGHFPGSSLKKMDGAKTADLLKMNHQFIGPDTAVTALSSVASLNLEEKNNFTQGLERFLDASNRMVYTALILAEPVTQQAMNQMQLAYEEIATSLSPFVKQSFSYSEQESDAVGTSLTDNFSLSIGESLSLTTTQGTTNTDGTTNTQGTSSGESTSESKNILRKLGSVLTGAKKTSTSQNDNQSTATSSSTAYSNSIASGRSDSKNTTEGQSSAKNETHTAGKSISQTIEIENKTASLLMTQIDAQIERVQQAKSFGGWEVAAYFVAEHTETSLALSSQFLALTRGQSSGVESYAFNTWNNENIENRNEVLTSLSNLQHPKIAVGQVASGLNISSVTPAIFATGQEMALQLSLPRRSTDGVSVIDAPAFGRSIKTLEVNTQETTKQKVINLGEIRHLWENQGKEINIELNRLCYHTLITGTTGVGKTTTIMNMIAQIHRYKIPFMVIEPAKGEYVSLLGLSTSKNKVSHLVAGRNTANALKINPFIFPEGIDLTDHIDRITNVFNAAFSMYGAMPQILEEAIFASYEQLGWDTVTSQSVFSAKQYPTIMTVLAQIPKVVEALGYSAQVSGDFVGALTARLRSLSRGSLGMTLICQANEETTYHDLFETSNVIDLSSMGSPDKRALVMGLMFMRLYEHRLANGLPETSDLRHLMVLEEAHVLLKKTSTAQSQETSNTAGLAVESFSNALAEMRAYGQGFMVADQSASALDDSVLKNTNIKIVMRAPYEADRIALGGSLALNEEQTNQLSKLENHTAVVHQSNWLEPVLCRIKKVDIKKVEPITKTENDTKQQGDLTYKLLTLLWCDRLNLPDCQEERNNTSLLNHFGFTQDELSVIKAFMGKNDKRINSLHDLIPIILNKLIKDKINMNGLSVQGKYNHLFISICKSLGSDYDKEKVHTIVTDVLKYQYPEQKQVIANLGLPH